MFFKDATIVVSEHVGEVNLWRDVSWYDWNIDIIPKGLSATNGKSSACRGSKDTLTTLHDPWANYHTNSYKYAQLERKLDRR